MDSELLRELNLLTTKPFLYVFNADEAVLTDAARVAELRQLIAPADAVFLDAAFEKGFIKAEIVSYDDLIAAGSMAAAKAAGKVRMEGKDYVMADGDVVEFRFNV